MYFYSYVHQLTKECQQPCNMVHDNMEAIWIKIQF